VPMWLIESPRMLTVERIAQEKNDEIRRIMIERYGAGKWLEDSGAKPVQSDDWGTLFDLGPYRIVKLINSTEDEDGSRREYYRTVPRECNTARSAIAWSYGLEEKEYAPEIMT